MSRNNIRVPQKIKYRKPYTENQKIRSVHKYCTTNVCIHLECVLTYMSTNIIQHTPSILILWFLWKRRSTGTQTGTARRATRNLLTKFFKRDTWQLFSTSICPLVASAYKSNIDCTIFNFASDISNSNEEVSCSCTATFSSH